VILLDTNVWLALVLSKHQFHNSVRNWLLAQSRRSSIAFCRATQHSFLRLLTTDAVTRLYDLAPMTNQAAREIYDSLVADGRIYWLPEPDDLEKQWRSLSRRGASSPKLWMDAYLAAFAITGKLQLLTTDRAFQQFKRLDCLLLSKS
jgi:toxin-antitoxin system PIN domain toxin